MAYQGKTLVLAIGAALLLAACGGSDGDSQTPQTQDPQTPAPKASPNSPTPAPQASPNAGAAPAPVASNGHYRVDGAVVPVNVTDLRVLNYNGRAIPLTLPGISSGGFTTISGNVQANGLSYQGFHVSGSQYDDIRFGIIGLDGKQILFAQGEPARTIPASGRVLYTGEALHQHKSDNSVHQAFASSTVDFAAKTVRLNISHIGNAAEVPTHVFAGTFNGPTFTLASEGTHPQGTAQGAFFDDDAEEMAGTYETAAARGVFGLEKNLLPPTPTP